MATGQSGQIELSIDTIKRIRIPVLPMAEQIEIVNEIEKHEEKILNFKNRIEELNNERKNIFNKYL